MAVVSQQLKRACSEGNLKEIQHLLEMGADVNGTDEHGSGTLLTFRPEIIEYLLSRGADPNIQAATSRFATSTLKWLRMKTLTTEGRMLR